MSRLIHDVPATSHFDFLYGSFNLSKWEIPYFATTLSLQEAASDLRLTSEIPGAEEIAWSIDELYQRDINWPRVQRQIVPYLRNSEVPQFFNSITIALLPFDQERSELVNEFDGHIDWAPPVLMNDESFGKTLEVGPISFGFWDSWNSPQDEGFRSGRMRWNRNQVFGVAIDGQHRLAALKELAEGGAVAGLHTSRVPVIFLLFDPRVGYQSPGDHKTVEILRALFIDLNKHAQTVKRGRQILLDDRDPHAVCVRTLVAERLSDDAGSLLGVPPRIPLSLVDWHSEQAKFDDGPYVSTVLGLDWMVIRSLDTKPISDWTDYTAVRRQVDRLQTRLGIQLTEASTRLAELENISMAPFVFSDMDLDRISTAFTHVWGGPLVHLLTKFSPYAELLAQRVEDGTLSLQFQQWFQLYEAKQKEGNAGGRATADYGRFVQRVGLHPEHPMGEQDFLGRLHAIEASKRDSLAFNVVFQRAFVEGFLEYAKFGSGVVEELALEEDEDEVVDFGDLVLDDDLDLDTEDEASFQGDETEVDLETSAFVGDKSLRMQYEARVEEYVRSLNRLVAEIPDVLEIEAGFTHHESGLTEPFWLGSLLKAEGGIDFTQSAAGRAKDLLFIVALADRGP